MSGENPRKQIIDGILAEAEEESARILKEAENAAQDTAKSAANQLQKVAADAEASADEQVGRIETAARTRLEAAERRIGLETREKLYFDLTSSALVKLHNSIDTPMYQGIISSWIIEAALGLRATSVKVNCSQEEKAIVSGILSAVESEIEKIGGISVKAEMSDEPPLTLPGVLVTSEDGKTAFNNQISNRMLRYQSEIRKLISDRLF
jgi:vacuolar-type H+-ATPase subunit E/Vma4